MVSILDEIHQPGAGEFINPYIKMFLYGDPGSGKTVFAATAPRPLIIDTENSTEVLDDWPELRAGCKIARITDWNQLDELFWAIKNGDPRVDCDTVVIDTLSELQSKNLDTILAQEAQKAAAKGETRSPFIPYQNDYKLSTEMLRHVITSFRDLDKHLIVTAHRKEDKDDTNRMYVRPQVTPKLADTLKGVFGVQAFLTYEIKEENGVNVFTNTLQTMQSRRVEAKSRLRHLPAAIEMPTFQDILDAKQLETKQTSEGEAKK